ncbi:MAG: hypothetical protein PHU85_01940 [Phycisphaerae bacterium]|nr:hypothetical protein [Phycisphaerae bacterium]
MPVEGCQPPPYHQQGLAQCLEQIRVAASKGAIIASELGEHWLMEWFCKIDWETQERITIMKKRHERRNPSDDSI